MPILQKVRLLFLLYVYYTKFITEAHWHENHPRWVRFRVRCLSYTSRLTGHSTPLLPHSKRETEGSRCQLRLYFRVAEGFPDHTTPPSFETRDGGSAEHEKTPTRVSFRAQWVSFAHASVGVERTPSMKRHQQWCLFVLGVFSTSTEIQRTPNTKRHHCWCLFMLGVFPTSSDAC